MTRRERLEAKAEKRREWAAGRKAKAVASFNAAHNATAMIPMGQPILVGHHSEKRHRAALARSDAGMRAGIESQDMAEHHESKADGIESQLDNSIFSDDPDAIEALEAKVAKLENQRDEWKRLNAYFRKHKTMRGFPGLSDEKAAEFDANIAKAYSWDKRPVAAYSLTNLGATIRNAKQRIEQIKAQQARSTKAEESGGIVIEGTGWVRITFADKPDRSILNDLKANGFRWGGGSWTGQREKIPASVLALKAE